MELPILYITTYQKDLNDLISDRWGLFSIILLNDFLEDCITAIYSQCCAMNKACISNGKICDIAKIDLNDSTTEFLLRLSYKLVEYLAINDLWHI